MNLHAQGQFEVKLTPQAPDERSDAVSIGRLLIEKQFQGDLKATSHGQMLAFRSEVQGSAGYVAMECVNGTLQDRTGSFVLQHSGTMWGGAQRLTISVVPDSGTGELGGLSGEMTIVIAAGKHSYEFEYFLPD